MSNLSITEDTWVISDTHFGHDNIIRFCGRPQDHEQIMIDRWRATVKPEDTILHLGDLAYRGDWPHNLKILTLLPGQKFFIRGNHDKQNADWYYKAGFVDVGHLLGTFSEEDVTRDGKPYTNTVRNYGFYTSLSGKRVLFSHYPDNWLKDWSLNIHGHIHNNPYSPKISDTSRYRNVGVEVINYTPVKISTLIN